MIMYRISATLKTLRRKRGLTLADLARRAGTSVSALSRYEHGWDRFEMKTLEKLASALGCALSVSLVTRKTLQQKTAKSEKDVLRALARLFWDRKPALRDIALHPGWLVKRVLDYGNEADIAALIQLLGRDRFLTEVSCVTPDSAKARAFWRAMLELEGISCTNPSSRRGAGNCWKR